MDIRDEDTTMESSAGGPTGVRIEVREMSLEYVEETANVHTGAFAGYMNVAMGQSYVRAFLSWFCRAPDAVAFNAWIDGDIVGYVVGAPSGYGRRLTRDLLWVVAGSFACRPWLMLRADIRGVLYSRLMGLRTQEGQEAGPEATGEVLGGVMSLVGIGVDVKARGNGVGGSLMRAFECASRERGMTAVRLSVYRDNTSACRVYERAGWQLIESGGGGGREVCYRKEIAQCGGFS